MPIFEVTFARTGTAMVEAENADQAKLVADDMPEENICWTDTWEATDAMEIASCPEEMGEDMKLVHTDPYAAAKSIAQKYGFYRSPTTDQRVCLIPKGKADPDVETACEELMAAGYEVQEEAAKPECFYDEVILIRPKGEEKN